MSSDVFELASIQSSEDNRSADSRLNDETNYFRWVDRIFLVSCVCIIPFVSAADTWLAVINNLILNEEANPVCEWLIRLAPDSCCYFVAAKICGTLLVMSTLYILLRERYRHARMVIAAVALFQVGLLTYLFLSDPKIGDWINFSVLFDDTELSFFDAKTKETNLSSQIEAAVKHKNLSGSIFDFQEGATGP